jgi:hypothetical protein
VEPTLLSEEGTLLAISLFSRSSTLLTTQQKFVAMGYVVSIDGEKSNDSNYFSLVVSSAIRGRAAALSSRPTPA